MYDQTKAASLQDHDKYVCLLGASHFKWGNPQSSRMNLIIDASKTNILLLKYYE